MNKLASVILLAASVSFSQPRGAQLGSGGTSSNGVRVQWETRLEPGSPPISEHGGGTISEKNVIKRHFVDFDNRTYFGYDLRAEPLPDGRIRLRFEPLTITPAKMSEIFKEVANWTPLPLPKGPATVEVRSGDTLAMDLFANPATAQRITDYLQFTIEGKQTDPAPAGPPRDFQVEDVSMQLMSPQVTVNGSVVASTTGGVVAPAIWMDLPGHGRFVFSLIPRPDLGLQKLGEVRGRRMSWRHAGFDYTVNTDKPIAPGIRAYNLYVLPVSRTVREFALMAGPKPDDPVHSRP